MHLIPRTPSRRLINLYHLYCKLEGDNSLPNVQCYSLTLWQKIKLVFLFVIQIQYFVLINDRFVE